MGAIRNSVIQRIVPPSPPNELTPTELAEIQARIHLKIYEPLVAHAEVVIDDNTGDLMMEWGGRYAS